MKLANTVYINAPLLAVWNITVAIESWPQWSPTFVSIQRREEGRLDVGSSALIKQPGLPVAKWVITALRPGEQFTWETSVRGVRMTATHELTAQEAGTESVLRIEMFGLIARLMWPLIWILVRGNSRSMDSIPTPCFAVSRCDLW